MEMHQEAPKFSEQDAVAVGVVRAGDPERYRELVERHHRRVYAVAWSRLGDPTLAEEVTQEAFIRAYRRLWMLGDGEKFAPWVSSIARRLAINSGLRHRRELSNRERWALEQALPDASSPQPEDTDGSCSPETLGHWLSELEPAHRECLVLFYLEGKSGAEAAAALGIKESALRVRLHRARSVLRERIEEHLGDSLKRLTPTRLLVPAILAGVLDSPSAQAAAAGGTAAVGVGAKWLTSASKFLPFSALVGWFPFIFFLPGFLLGSWLGRLERRNFRDAQGFRAGYHWSFQRSALWGLGLVFLSIVVLPHFAGFAVGGVVEVLSVAPPLAAAGLIAVMMLTVSRQMMIQRNPFQMAMFASVCIVTSGLIALLLGWLPLSLSLLPQLVHLALLITTFNARPARMDYNLFLRARQGMLRDPLVAKPTQSARSMSRADLMHFARFLGSRWLASWYRWDPQGILLHLSPVRPGYFGLMIPMISCTSHVLLRKDGTVVAHCGEADARDLACSPPDAVLDLPDLEREVAASVTRAWHAFRDGDAVAAARGLGEIPESDIFVVPPAQSRFSRWTRIILGAHVVLGLVFMFTVWRGNQLPRVQGRDLKPVAITEAEIRVALDPQGKQGAGASNALPELSGFFGWVTILPDPALFTSNRWVSLRHRLLDEGFSSNRTPAERIEHLLGSTDMVRFCANDWFSPEDFGLTPESMRQALRSDLLDSHKRWFVPEVVPVQGNTGETVDFSVLATGWVDLRILCLKRFGCLDAVDGSAVIEAIIQHQVLSDRLPEGRRRVPFPQLLHGLFHTHGWDPISDTYHALVILECFGALDRVDREACIQGILRFHHGRGLFGSVRTRDGFAIDGDARDTAWAFESLRMLGALDRVPDLSQWQFRPFRSSQSPVAPGEIRRVEWFEIEAWVCQQRLSRIVAEREPHPSAPVRSLMEP